MYVGDHPSNNISHPAPGPRTELAGDVVPFPIVGRGIAQRAKETGQSFEDSLLDYSRNTATKNTLGKALGRDNVIPLVRPGE